jgi:hypothetical protein
VGLTVDVNKMVDPAQTLIVPFTAAGIVVNVAV